MEQQVETFEHTTHTITFEVERRRLDGALELFWSNDGRVRVAAPVAEHVDRYLEARFDAGDVVVLETFGEQRRPAQPVVPVSGRTNPYGMTVQRWEFGAGLEVSRSFDDDARLCEVVVRTPIAVHRFSIAADGAWTLEWQLHAAAGRRRGDASGHIVEDSLQQPAAVMGERRP